ncbi:unnamed protein product [Bursaphelenchus okinawaensis]|uniref:Transmembrane protein 170A n=1 Tax=Bursaphelenchus okinawaensis TaxID=465554 RepID=A0A811JVH1_9BILA|nr:unnamed protein product [Bursaphelenchus okinawaensis]CAG9085598.1 unnamed protein product [Bursaphelenchus okinawaensis]
MDTQTVNPDYDMWSVLSLQENNVNGFWQLWLSIFIWMAVSYIFVHAIAFLVAVISLRYHPWVFFISFPFLLMMLLGPTTVGALTSASIALTFSMAQKSITAWHCLFIGCGQTLIVLMTSFFRILATL